MNSDSFLSVFIPYACTFSHAFFSESNKYNLVQRVVLLNRKLCSTHRKFFPLLSYKINITLLLFQFISWKIILWSNTIRIKRHLTKILYDHLITMCRETIHSIINKFILELEKNKSLFYTKTSSQGLWYYPFLNFDRPAGNSFSF